MLASNDQLAWGNSKIYDGRQNAAEFKRATRADKAGAEASPVRQRAERPPRLGGAGGPGIGRDATLPQLKDHFAEATMLFISEHGAICWTAAGPCEHHVNVRVAVWQILNQT